MGRGVWALYGGSGPFSASGPGGNGLVTSRDETRVVNPSRRSTRDPAGDPDSRRRGTARGCGDDDDDARAAAVGAAPRQSATVSRRRRRPATPNRIRPLRPGAARRSRRSARGSGGSSPTGAVRPSTSSTARRRRSPSATALARRYGRPSSQRDVPWPARALAPDSSERPAGATADDRRRWAESRSTTTSRTRRAECCATT
jgi:hypothetical protein